MKQKPDMLLVLAGLVTFGVLLSTFSQGDPSSTALAEQTLQGLEQFR